MKKISVWLLVVTIFTILGIASLLSNKFVNAADTNLIVNPSVETASITDPTLPDKWTHDKYGTNTTTFTFPVTGYQSTKAIKIQTTAWTSGDAKWYFQDIPISANQTYIYSDYYTSTVKSDTSIRYTLTTGAFLYTYLGTTAVSGSWKQNTYTFTTPANVKSLTVFRLIAAVGTLTTDNFSLTLKANPTPAPTITPTPISTPSPTPTPTSTPDPGNLILNSSLESSTNGTTPDYWFADNGWGIKTATFAYPVAGFDGNKAARINVTQYTSGDAKWVFQDVAINAGGNYTFSDIYQSSATSEITIKYLHNDGTTTFQWMADLPAASTWTNYQTTFSVPDGVTSLTVFHSIISLGFLTIDNYKLASADNVVYFNQGIVSLDFDDGSISAFSNGIPILNTVGFKSTQYIITSYINNDPDYVTSAEILQMQNQGHEIQDHTQTHPHMQTLTQAQIFAEISGAKTDLQNIGITSVNAFAYPYGEYNDTIINVLKQFGFQGARSTDRGFNYKNTDKYTLKAYSFENNDTLDFMKSLIDDAVRTKTWVIFTFHQIDDTGWQFSTSPAKLQAVVDYLKQNNVPVVTVSQGLQMMSQ